MKISKKKGQKYAEPLLRSNMMMTLMALGRKRKIHLEYSVYKVTLTPELQ